MWLHVIAAAKKRMRTRRVRYTQKHKEKSNVTTRNLNPQPSEWYSRQSWRQQWTNDQQDADAIRTNVELVTRLGVVLFENWDDYYAQQMLVNQRAALYQIIGELRPFDLGLIFQLARLLCVTEQSPNLIAYLGSAIGLSPGDRRWLARAKHKQTLECARMRTA
jgi:hypothetical protein